MMYTMYTVYMHLLLVSFYCIDWQLLAESLKLIDIDYNNVCSMTHTMGFDENYVL